MAAARLSYHLRLSGILSPVVSPAEGRQKDMKKKEPLAREPLARVNLRLPADLWKRAQHHAIDHDLSAQELVRLALEAYLKGAK